MKIKTICFYLLGALGAFFLMLLRIFDKANALSVIIVTLGLTFFLYSIRHADKRYKYLYLGCLMAVTFLVRFYGYTGGGFTDAILGILIGLIMFIIMGVERLFKRFENHFWYTLIYPILYFSFMWFTEIIKINMPFRLDSYFSCMPLLCQITSILGIYIIDFLLAWTASVLVFIVDHIKNKKWVIPVTFYVGVLAFVFIFGAIHMNKMDRYESEKSNTIRIAYITGPYQGDFMECLTVSLSLEETISSFKNAVMSAKEENAEILVFSEEAYIVDDTDEAYFLELAKSLALENNMHLCLAYEVNDTDSSDGGKGINKLCFISNRGEILYEYIKHCIVPIVETSDYVTGDKVIEPFEITINKKTLTVSAAICYDSDFDSFMSHMGNNIDLLFIPTWDWDIVSEEHFSVARLRAIASETTVIRSTYDGYSAVIDSCGNILKCDNVNKTGYESILVCDVPVK